MVQRGFHLSKVIVEGHSNLSQEDVYSFIDYSDKNFILDLNLCLISQKVLAHPWVKRCVVRRSLPDTLHIKVVERTPIAIWQYQYRYHLIDRDGECINLESFDLVKFADLINVVGKGANLYADQLIKDMSHDSFLKEKVKIAVRYGERRWDIFLNEILIKMPEKNFIKAWNYLAAMHTKGKLLDCGIKTIDLRNEEKFYIEYR
jgi:cell division protein FtsQ